MENRKLWMPIGAISLLRPTVYKELQAIEHWSPTRGPPGCIMRPAATIKNCLFTTKITQNSVTPSTTMNWESKTSGYAENPDNWIFL